MQGNLKIVLWNANGVQRRTELEKFLNETKADVCLITETHLKPESCFRIRGFQIHHTPHPSNRAIGGSGIIIRDDIEHIVKPDLRDDRFQLTVVSIQSLKLKLGAVYVHPNNNLKVDDYNEFLAHAGDRFILGGDFNAKHTEWGSRLTNTKGRNLLKAIRGYGCGFRSTEKPTHVPKRGEADLLDFFITKGVGYHLSIDENPYLSSDHRPITLDVALG